MKRRIGALLGAVRGILGAGTLCLAAMEVSAEIKGSFFINGDGTVTYFYEVDNSAGLFDIAAWSLDLPFPNPDWDQLDSFSGGDVAVPDPLWFADAGIPLSGLTAQDFLALDPAGDVLIGSALGGFSFISAFLPGPIPYYEFSALGDFATGSTTGPVGVIPEGGGWMGGLALASIIGFAAGRRRFRKPAVIAQR